MYKEKLTNKDIMDKYKNIEFHVMINDFKGAFAGNVITHDQSNSYHLSIKAIEAYTKWLEKKVFKTRDTVVKVDFKTLEKLTSDDVFVKIPEVLAMNQLGKGFVDLGALSRNVFFQIIREHITTSI